MDDSAIAFKIPWDQIHSDHVPEFDENKCRNVLVRYCAHIPRNYRYRDGVRLVFLVLRDHLGDERLGLAGGVLYELIEVDCQHSHDPGAAFQRWRHDHMNRHEDLELPHIPHLTTVLSTITPTATLAQWRRDHPERYLTRLSDHGSTQRRPLSNPSCIRTRKDWMIEYTMYVSSQDSGTHPFRCMDAKEFHEMQWSQSSGHRGRLIEEKSIDLNERSWNSEPKELPPAHRTIIPSCHFKESVHKRGQELRQLARKIRSLKKPVLGQDSLDWIASQPGFNTSASLLDILEYRSSMRVNEWEIPNANFARKFGLYTDGLPLPPFIKELPVAEDKAMDTATNPPVRGHWILSPTAEALPRASTLSSMSQDSPSKGKSRHSDPSTSSLTPLQGTFLSVSPSSRARSLSPRKRLVRQPLHIRMNLTETQMDKITDAFTHKVGGSPAKARARAAPKSTPRKSKSSQAQDLSQAWDEDDSQNDIYSPTFSELMPKHPSDAHGSLSPSLAARRRKVPPPPIQTYTGPNRPNVPQRAQMESVSESVSPLTPARYNMSHIVDEDKTSIYSQETPGVVPLDLGTINHRRNHSKANDAVVDSYKDWAQIMHSPPSSGESPTRSGQATRRPRRSKSNAEGLRQQYPDASVPAPSPCLAGPGNETPLFSPLQFYFRGHDFPMIKKGEKTMIGDNGWLERTGKPSHEVKKTTQKKTGIIDSIKKMAKDMAELHHASRKSNQPVRERPTSRVAISLEPREQSLLYCELEFRLSNALNHYITVQLDKGCLVPDKLKKVSDSWSQRGRPKVVGFRYDLETQLELINLHIPDFRFYGRRQGDPVEIAGLLYTMKVNARAMSIRTFCQPDPVIAKQLVDAQSLFKLLGVPDEQQIALAEIAQFFKVIVERELDRHEQREYETRKRNREQADGGDHWQTKGTLRERGN